MKKKEVREMPPLGIFISDFIAGVVSIAPLGIFMCGFIAGIMSIAVIMASVELFHACIKKNKERVSPEKINGGKLL